MKYRKTLSRRTLLKAGGVAIGLPLLDAMLIESAFGQTPPPVDRMLTFFFGLGVPKEIHAGGFTDALSPLAPHASKLALVRGIDMDSTDTGRNNHEDGSGGVFRGVTQSSAGASIDQVILEALHPTASPTPIETLIMGSFHRGDPGRPQRFTHSWRADGSPVEVVPKETPVALFERVFGTGNQNGGDTVEARHERSILDSVVDQYQYWTSDASGLGQGDRTRLSNHLEQVRELERRVAADASNPTCSFAPPPPTADNLGLQSEITGGDVPTLDPTEWEQRWQLMADIFVAAMRCDSARFGTAMFQSGGERVILRGNYEFADGTVHDFDEPETAHEFWHDYTPGGSNTDMKWHTRFIMQQIAYFIAQLDDPNFADPNGKSIFENSGFIIGTELGNGNRHDLESVFHVTNGMGDRLATGQVFDTGSRDCVDLYNTALTAYGIQPRMGDLDYYNGDISELLVNPDPPRA